MEFDWLVRTSRCNAVRHKNSLLLPNKYSQGVQAVHPVVNCGLYKMEGGGGFKDPNYLGVGLIKGLAYLCLNKNILIIMCLSVFRGLW